MSASCQSIDSMFELRPIHASAKFKSVKEPEAEIPPVELVAKLVEVELKELGFYVMISIKYAPLGIADGNVYPWQDFPDTLFVVRNDGLALASAPTLQRAVFLLLRRFGGEEAFVYLHILMKYRTAVAPAHHVTQLVNHFPYGLVMLAPKLALYLLCRYGTLGGRQEEHGRKPITYGQTAALHHRT